MGGKLGRQIRRREWHKPMRERGRLCGAVMSLLHPDLTQTHPPYVYVRNRALLCPHESRRDIDGGLGTDEDEERPEVLGPAPHIEACTPLTGRCVTVLPEAICNVVLSSTGRLLEHHMVPTPY